MTPLTFTLRERPEVRLDLSALTAERLAPYSRSEWLRLPLSTGRRPVVVGDIFDVAGTDVADIVFEGGDSRLDLIGAGMATGRMRVAGNAGWRVGRQMRGGTLLIDGSAGLQAGSGMTGGRLEISGDAGDSLGGPMAGEVMGMAGGLLIVRGRAGRRAGEKMRRGIIAVLGGCGDQPGLAMIAGTIVVTGEVGAMPGYLMKRGSLLFDRRPAALSPTFVDCGRVEIAFSTVFDRYLMGEGITATPLLGRAPQRFGGDNAVLGKGEILFSEDA